MNPFLLLMSLLCCIQPGQAPTLKRSSVTHPKKIALLVGINEYQHIRKPLKGCVNDVQFMKQLLIDKFGFEPQHITTLTNEQATHGAMISHFQHDLIDQADTGDVVFFMFSGHGSQQMDNDAAGADEPDGLDETIIPYDYNTLTTEEAVYGVADDEINGLLAQLTRKTKNITLVLDACHSGGGTRNMYRKRSLDETDTRKPHPLAAFALPDKQTIPYTLVAGCRSDEQSSEFECAPGVHQGILSYHLIHELRKARGPVTWNDVMENVKSAVNRQFSTQHPQLEGSLHSLLFDSPVAQAENYLLVSPGTPGIVKIAGGHMLGLTAGSVFEVYPPGSKQFNKPAQALGSLEITQVGLTESEGRWMAPLKKNLVANSRAVERKHYYPNPSLHLAFTGDWTGSTATALQARLLQLPGVSPGNADNAQLVLNQAGGQIQLSPADNPTHILRTFAASQAASTLLEQEISTWNRWYNVLLLENRQSLLEVQLKATMTKVDAQGRPDTVNAADHVFTAGETVSLEIVNNSDRDLFFYIIDLQEDGSIDVIHLGELNTPASNANEPVRAHSRWKGKVETYIKGDRPTNKDILKVFASTNGEVNIRFLSQKGSYTHKGSFHPLELLFNFNTRGLRPAQQPAVLLDAWITLDRVIKVKQKS